MVGTQDRLSAQYSVLGSLVLEPKLMGEAMTRIRDEDFLEPSCRMVWQALKALFIAGSPIDPVMLRDKLGGHAGDSWSQFLLQIMEITPTAANIWAYVEVMREQARKARVAELGGLIQAATSWEQQREYISKLNALTIERQSVRRLSMEEMLLDFAERHTTAHQYLTWGLPKLDDGVYIELGDMLVLGGYPSAGKTALAVSCAYHQAKDYRVGFYSLETNQHKLADRLISNLAGIDMPSIKRGKIDDGQWELLASCSDRVRVRKLDLIEAAGMSVEDIRSDALSNCYQIIYVDYLQLVEPESRKVNRTEQVSGISRGFQTMAHELGITVVALSQLTTPDTTSEGKPIEPTMLSLRESRQITMDADAVLLLYLHDQSDPMKSIRVLKIGKNKEGKLGKVYLAFDGTYQRFRQTEAPDDVDEPTPRKAARREPEYRQTAFYDLPGSEPVPFEEGGGTA